MLNVSDGPPLPGRFLRRVRSVWPLTVRQRILVYLVLGALAGLACGGVNYDIDANAVDCNVAGKDQTDCDIKARSLACTAGGVFSSQSGGRCDLGKCSKPCDAPATPLASCPFGKTSGGVAWTLAACKAQSLAAGCTSGTVYSFGCFGYHCSNLKCGR